jgi:hypothetical protein
MDKIKYILISFIVGGIIGYFLLPKVPDIKTVKEYIAVTKVINRDVFKDRVIDRKVYVDTGGHTVTEEHETIKDKIVEKEVEKIVEKKTEKLINYTGSVFVLWNTLDLKIYPSDVGASFMVLNPIEVMAQYDIDNKKVKAGILLKF